MEESPTADEQLEPPPLAVAEAEPAADRLWQKLETAALIDAQPAPARLRYRLELAEAAYNRAVVEALAGNRKVANLYLKRDRAAATRAAAERAAFDAHEGLNGLEREFYGVNKRFQERRGFLVEETGLARLLERHDEALAALREVRQPVIFADHELRAASTELAEFFEAAISNAPGALQPLLACRQRLFCQLGVLADMVAQSRATAEEITLSHAKLEAEQTHAARLADDRRLEADCRRQVSGFLRVLRAIDRALASGLAETVVAQLAYDSALAELKQAYEAIQNEEGMNRLRYTSDQLRGRLVGFRRDICEYNPRIANPDCELRALESRLKTAGDEALAGCPFVAEKRAEADRLGKRLAAARLAVSEELALPPAIELAIGEDELRLVWPTVPPAERGALKRGHPRIVSLAAALPA